MTDQLASSRWAKFHPIFKTFVSPISTTASSGLSLAILLIASHHGSFSDIAAYSTGAAAVALFAAALSGGTTLAFVNGDSELRAAVSKVRLRFVAPALLLAGFLTSFLYNAVSDLPVMAVSAGALSVCLNNLAELESSRLKRHLHTGSVLTVTLLARGSGVLIVLNGSFSLAMVASSALSFTGLLFCSRLMTPAIGSTTTPFFESAKMAYSPFYVSVAVLDTLVLRAPFLLVGLQVFSGEVDSMASLFSAQQGVTAVLIAAVFTTMSVRGRTRVRSAWMSHVDRVTVLFAVLVAVVGACFSDSFVGVLGLSSERESIWFALLSLAVVPYVLNRVNQYRDHPAGRHRRILLRLSITAVSAVISLSFAVWFGNPNILAATWLIAETTALLLVWLAGWLGPLVHGRNENLRSTGAI